MRMFNKAKNYLLYDIKCFKCNKENPIDHRFSHILKKDLFFMETKNKSIFSMIFKIKTEIRK
jgi:hypothetical protein